MGRKKKQNNFSKNNYKFIDSAILNDMTFHDYLDRFKKVALSIFEWVNLPSSMNAQFLEKTLYTDGMATLLKDNNYGFINTRCASSGMVNIYDLPTQFNCYSFEYQSIRRLYTGLKSEDEDENDSECILVQNNFERTPTEVSMILFALRLYEAERTIDVNIKSQKTPVMVIVDEKQRLMMENLYSQYDGNKPFIFGDSHQLKEGLLRAIKTDAPFVADKIMQYKKEIWNEALTFLRY